MILCAVVISMAGYWLTQGRHIPTRTEVIEMIETRAPYVQDRALIRETLEKQQEFAESMRTSLDANTRAIIKLQTTLEVLDRLTNRDEHK